MINTTMLGDIWECVVRNNSEGLDDIIDAYIQKINYQGTVEEWKIENVEMLRGWAYPFISIQSALRSLLKVHSNDPGMVAEGQAEIDILNGECVQVEQDFPHNTPQVSAITAKVIREPGWNNNLGFRVIFTLSDPSYIPANIALAVYSGAECSGYLYTTGALSLDQETGLYYTVCPPGFEPGDTDIHFGLLYAAINLSCWTLSAGTSEQVFEVYGE